MRVRHAIVPSEIEAPRACAVVLPIKGSYVVFHFLDKPTLKLKLQLTYVMLTDQQNACREPRSISVLANVTWWKWDRILQCTVLWTRHCCLSLGAPCREMWSTDGRQYCRLPSCYHRHDNRHQYLCCKLRQRCQWTVNCSCLVLEEIVSLLNVYTNRVMASPQIVQKWVTEEKTIPKEYTDTTSCFSMVYHDFVHSPELLTFAPMITGTYRSPMELAHQWNI